ncbi:MAG: DUF3046 domain-containing protein [Canibacter sp.]
MKRSEFRRAVEEEFGEVYSGVVLRDYWLPSLGMTGSEALDDGATPRNVWLALCDEFHVSAERRYGRGLLDPKDE